MGWEIIFIVVSAQENKGMAVSNTTQRTFTCSYTEMETLEKGVKSVQS